MEEEAEKESPFSNVRNRAFSLGRVGSHRWVAKQSRAVCIRYKERSTEKTARRVRVGVAVGACGTFVSQRGATINV